MRTRARSNSTLSNNMTREHTRLVLPALEAWAAGKTIQGRIKGLAKWEDIQGDNPDFENPHWEWRTKPEPRKIWINEYEVPGGGTRFGYVHLSAADAQANSSSAPIARAHEITLSE